MGQASKQAGVSEAMLSCAIKSSKVSANNNTSSGWDMDPAKLFSVYPQPRQRLLTDMRPQLRGWFGWGKAS